MIRLLQVAFLIFSAITWPSVVLGFENHDVHPEINHKAAGQSSLDDYLKKELYLREGLDTELSGVQITDLLKKGGMIEDTFPRPKNHFHDPLKPWESAGLSGTTSALLWAQKESNEASWGHARQWYFQALTTGSPEAYAAAFQSLGQLMHLVADMAVPAHVRDDWHLEVMLSDVVPITHFEVYTKNDYKNLNYNGTPFNPGLGIFSLAKNPDTVPSPVSALFDIDAYGGGNPEVTRGGSIGLAEYTNANFLSEGRMFGAYPYPASAETNYEDVHEEPRAVLAKDDKEDLVRYVTRKDDPGFRIAAISYWATNHEPGSTIYGEDLVLDDGVFEDYAAKLVPRAVGYSSALLDYFFRGKLDIAAVPIIMNETIWGIMFSIQNITPTEEALAGGKIAISFSTPGTAPDGSPTVLQAAIIPLTTAVPFEDAKRLSFWLDRPISMADFETLKNATFTIAYRGVLGQEPDAVIGKVFKLASVLELDEEWDTLAGNYAWNHATAADNPDNGSTSNTVNAGVLLKDNVRYADSDSDAEKPRYNSTYIDLVSAENPSGILVTPKTYIEYKVDDISIVNAPVAPEGYTDHWQGIWLKFNNGLLIQLSYDAFVNLGGKTAYWRFFPGNVMIDNIYEILYSGGLEIPEPLYLQKTSIIQQLDQSPDSPLEAKQHIEVDFIRIIDGAIKTEEATQ